LLIPVGVIRSAHGLRGYFRIEAYSGSSRTIRAQEKLMVGATEAKAVPYKVEDIKEPRKGVVLLKLAGVENPDDVEALKDFTLSVDEKDLPELLEGSFYDYMLVGCEVRLFDQSLLGIVERVDKFPANDVIVARGQDGREILIPAIKDIVREVDIKARKIVVEDRKGLR